MNIERFYPGYLIKDKKDGTLHIVEGDYALLCSGMGKSLDFDDLGLYHLDEDMNIVGNSAWHYRSNYEIIDKNHMIENLNKVTKYLTENEEDLIENEDDELPLEIIEQIDFTKNVQLHIKVQNKPDEWRIGQAYFNYAYELYPKEADELRGTEYDCFYVDERIPVFLKKLNEKLLTL